MPALVFLVLIQTEWQLELFLMSYLNIKPYAGRNTFSSYSQNIKKYLIKKKETKLRFHSFDYFFKYKLKNF